MVIENYLPKNVEFLFLDPKRQLLFKDTMLKGTKKGILTLNIQQQFLLSMDLEDFGRSGKAVELTYGTVGRSLCSSNTSNSM